MSKPFWVFFPPFPQPAPLVRFLDEHMLRSLTHSDNFSWPAEPVITNHTLLSLLLTLLVGTLKRLLAGKWAQGAPSVGLFPHYTSKKFSCDSLYPYACLCVYVCVCICVYTVFIQIGWKHTVGANCNVTVAFSHISLSFFSRVAAEVQCACVLLLHIRSWDYGSMCHLAVSAGVFSDWMRYHFIHCQGAAPVTWDAQERQHLLATW